MEIANSLLIGWGIDVIHVVLVVVIMGFIILRMRRSDKMKQMKTDHEEDKRNSLNKEREQIFTSIQSCLDAAMDEASNAPYKAGWISAAAYAKGKGCDLTIN